MEENGHCGPWKRGNSEALNAFCNRCVTRAGSGHKRDDIQHFTPRTIDRASCGREWSMSGGSRALKESMTAVILPSEKARADHPMPTGKVTPHHTHLNGKGPDDPPEGSS